MNVQGSCHCGNIQYDFATAMDIQALPVRRCSCSFCSCHGARHTSEPHASLTVNIKDKDSISHYRFASKVVEFMICSNCGVMPCAITRIDDRNYAVINVNTTKATFAREQASIDFSTESIEESQLRRKKNWIANVSVIYT